MISTGIKRLDDFFNGGLPSGNILDVFGSSGTGKTLFLLQISFFCIKKGGSVLYLDTTGSFRPERIVEFNKNQNFNILDRITVHRLTNTFEQIKSIETITQSNFSIILIDNVTELFSYEYPDEKDIFQKNFLFMRFMHNLSKAGITKHIPIVLTNTVRNIDGKESENMANAIDLFTHAKMRLYKTPNKFHAQLQWLEKNLEFDYTFDSSGMIH